MSPVLLNAYEEMRPRLEAEEALLTRMVIASGTGTLKKSVDKDFVNTLVRQSRARTGTRVRTLADLEKTGIKIVRGGGQSG